MKRLAALVLIVLAACGANKELSGDLRTVGSVTVTFKVEPAQVRIGQPVRIGFRLTNYDAKTKRLDFPSGQRYDFWATRDGKTVWRWSKGIVFVQEITHDEIQSQTSVSYARTWTPDHAGTYQIHGSLTAEGFGGEMRGTLVVS
jgi:hypothetical protein